MNEQRNDGGAAFPKAGLDPWAKAVEVSPGMTLRDYFAAKALQGLCANPGAVFQANDRTGWGFVNCRALDAAHIAYEMADAMLKAREA